MITDLVYPFQSHHHLRDYYIFILQELIAKNVCATNKYLFSLIYADKLVFVFVYFDFIIAIHKFDTKIDEQPSTFVDLHDT